MKSEAVIEEESERPKAVTVIGWVWIVAAGLYFLRSVVDLVMWRALQPAAPALFRESSGGTRKCASCAPCSST